MPSQLELKFQEYQEIVRGAATHTLSRQEAGERLVRLDPEFGLGHLYLAMAKYEAGDPDGAVTLLWRALPGLPCDHNAYLMLSELLLARNPADPVAHRLKALGLWKLSFAEKIPPEIAGAFQDSPPAGDLNDPATYAAWAQSYQETHCSDSPDADDRVMPLWVLNDLQRQAPEAISEDLLQRILDNPTQCAPVFRAAFREWTVQANVISPEAVGLVVALIGEQGGPDVLPDLLAFTAAMEETTVLLGIWAIWRLGQRFPAETLAAFRAATAGADVSQRLGIAEQIELLPETPGKKPALVDLLEGFSSFAAEDDAPILLICVTEILSALSFDREVKRLRERYLPMLPDEGRRIVREVMRLPDMYEPMLETVGIPNANIDAVCLDRVFFREEIASEPGDEEDEGFDEDEFDDEVDEDDEGPSPPQVKPDRNSPCWCGSGKKYKKCHLQLDEELERSGAARGQKPAHMSLNETMKHRLFEAIGEVRSRSEIRESHLLYFDKPVDDFDPENPRAESFYEWSILDFRPGGSGRTVLEEYLRRRPRLPERERAILESWRASRLGLFEVVRIEHGKGVELREAFTGDQMFVGDMTTTRPLHRGDSILIRVQQFDGNWFFTGDGMKAVPAMRPKLQAKIEEESRKAGQSPADFIRSNSHRIHRFLEEVTIAESRRPHSVTAEGDTIEFSSATYLIKDETALADALTSVDVFEETTPKDAAPDRRTFAWLETGAVDGPRRTFGRVEIHNGRFVLECNSRRRLSIGRQLLEKHATQFLTHEADSFRQPGAVK